MFISTDNGLAESFSLFKIKFVVILNPLIITYLVLCCSQVRIFVNVILQLAAESVFICHLNTSLSKCIINTSMYTSHFDHVTKIQANKKQKQ